MRERYFHFESQSILLNLRKKKNSLFFFFEGVLDLSKGQGDRTNKENTKAKENEKRN